jgi:hypothetical protein
MHDYDVEAVSLQTPPSSAVIQSYRPAVLVRNNGVHDALAVGSLRIYSPAGLLIFTTALYSGVIAPDETKPAQAVDYWTPPALGRYMVIATVTCINDQYEPNNNLAPVSVDIIAGEPEPPTPVQMHAAQHEEGGGDELNIDGLHGRAVDAQTPAAHKTSHQAAGSDALNVTGLAGILSERQPIAEHHEEHENHGTDELNVDNLHGELWNRQKPLTHANEAHDPNFATTEALSNHLNDTHDVHPDTDNIEYVERKGEPEGYAGLDADALVPVDQLGTGAVATGAFLESHSIWTRPLNRLNWWITDSVKVIETVPTTLIDFHETRPQDGVIYDFDLSAELVSTIGANSLIIKILAGNSELELTEAVSALCTLIPGVSNRRAYLRASIQLVVGNFLPGSALAIDNLGASTIVQLPTLTDVTGGAHEGVWLRATALLAIPATDTELWFTNVALSKRTP